MIWAEPPSFSLLEQILVFWFYLMLYLIGLSQQLGVYNILLAPKPTCCDNSIEGQPVYQV